MSQTYPIKDAACMDRLIAAFEQQNKILSDTEKQAVKAIFSNIAGQNDSIAEYYDIVAPFYDHFVLNFMGYQAASRLARALEAQVDFADLDVVIFDAGAGTGLLGELLRQAGFHGSLTGIDISEKSVEFIRKHRSTVYNETQVGDLTNLTGILASDAFDVAASAGVIGTAPPEALDELLRVTRPKGLIAYSLNKARYESEPAWQLKHDRFLQQELWRPIDGCPQTCLYYESPLLEKSEYIYVFMFRRTW